MNDIDISKYLPILSIGLWVGVFITFVSKLISFTLSTIIGWFKHLV